MTILQFPGTRPRPRVGKLRTKRDQEQRQHRVLHADRLYPRGFGVGDPATVVMPFLVTVIGATIMILAWLVTVSLLPGS